MKIWNKIKWILGIIVTAIATIFVGKIIKEKAVIGYVEKPKNWTEINEKTIALVDNSDNMRIVKTVKLPRDPKTKKQLKTNDIAFVGTANGGKQINVEIRHTPVNRNNHNKHSGK